MLGLFDTVASVGLTDAVGNSGHNFWAQAKDLQIPSKVKNCLHHVALHDLRTNFPCDSVALGEELPTNCQEHHCPGAHSDVGGGYAAGEQGKGIRKARSHPREPKSVRPVPDENARLSNLTLNHMYDAALRACRQHVHIPWINVASEEERELGGLSTVFGLDGLDMVRKQVTSYFDATPTTNTRDALRDHGLRYLTWRYKLTQSNRFKDMPSMDAAESLDTKGFRYCRQGEEIFKKQIANLSDGTANLKDLGYNNHAHEIFGLMTVGQRAFRPEWGDFFDGWVHDSFSGFISKFHEEGENWIKSVGGNVGHSVAERQGFVRWRQLYQGGTTSLNAQLPGDLNDDSGTMA